MELEAVVKDFKSKVCEQLRLTQEGENRFRVFGLAPILETTG
jgi:hypothetical protein